MSVDMTPTEGKVVQGDEGGLKAGLRSPMFRGAVVVAVFALVAPTFIRGYYLYVLELTAVYTILAMGLNIVAGYAGQLSLGHTGIYAAGAYVSALMVINLNLPFPVALVGAIVAGAIVGLILGVPSLRLGHWYLAMVTLCFALVVPQLLLAWEPLTKGTTGLMVPPVSLFGNKLDKISYYYLIVIFAFVIFALGRNLICSRWGRAFIAVRDHEITAESTGISLYMVKLSAFVISSVSASVAGALYGPLLGFLSPDTFHLDNSLLFLLSIVVGGMGTLVGPIVGTFLLTLLPEALSAFQAYRMVVYGATLMLLMIFIPEGIMGGVRKLTARARGTTTLDEREKAVVGEVVEPPAYSYRQFHRNAGPLLVVKGITKNFGGLRAIDNVEMRVETGSIHALIGPNGSGKTTMLNLVSGFYRIDSGSIEFAGQRIDAISPHRTARLGIARTFQTPKVLGSATVLENVMLGLFMHGRAGMIRTIFRVPPAISDEQAVRRKALEWLQFMGLAHRQNELAKNLPH
ncbi:MAG: ATP-binding cassette domain-containing protein, partial [Dehalococcoidia bacterium]|nr:ATP-binding cassette domain-containing protein [Dehalococcoidia bacterium]